MSVPKSKPKSKKKPTNQLERKRLDPVARRQQLLAAAKVVLAGNPDATLDEIANEAAVTRQAVSLHFPGGGTGPIYEAMLDEFFDAALTFLIPTTVKLAAISSRAGAIRAANESFLNWADSFGVPWVFSPARNRPGTQNAEKWERAVLAMADAILVVQPQFGRSQNVRQAVRVTLEGLGILVPDVLAGRLSRDDYLRISELQFVALFETVLPALAD